MAKTRNGRGSIILAAAVLAWMLIGGGLVWTLAGSSACSKKSKPNVLIVTMDTTRADHIRAYGHSWIETPTLNRLAREGVLFERFYSHIPLTLPAHTSIFTGTVPLYNGVIDNGAYRVPAKLETMAEALKKNGYQTAAFISAAVLRKVFKLDQGFDHWDEEELEEQEEGSVLVAERLGNKTADASMAWLSEHHDKPFFMWVHFYDPHATYDPPEEYKLLYPSKYDGEIAFMDKQIGRLFDKLKELKVYDDTIIICLGDHGEGLGEHDEPTHSNFIYEGTQHIPMIARFPNMTRPGTRIKTIASQIDVLPTVLDYLGIEIPAQASGESLWGLIDGATPPPADRFAYMESKSVFLHYGWAPLSGLVNKEYKYIKSPKPLLFDLEDDPKELKNLIEGGCDDEDPAKRDACKQANIMRSRLDGLESEWSRDKLESAELEEGDLSPEIMAQLDALGYVVGGFEGDVNKAMKKDVLDYQHLIPKLQNLNQLLVADQFDKMLAVSDEVLEGDTQSPVALETRAKALFALGRYEEAIAAYHTWFTRQVENEEGWVQIGKINMRLADAARQKDMLEEAQIYLQDAAKAFQKSIELKDSVQARYFLGRIYLELGDHDKAFAEFQNEKVVDTPLGAVGMALVYKRQGRPALAEAEFQRAGQLAKPDDILYLQEWAQFLIEQGRIKESLEPLEKSFEEDPSLKLVPKFMEALINARVANGLPPEGSPKEEEGKEKDKPADNDKEINSE